MEMMVCVAKVIYVVCLYGYDEGMPGLNCLCVCVPSLRWQYPWIELFIRCSFLEMIVILAGVVYVMCLHGDDGVSGLSYLCGEPPWRLWCVWLDFLLCRAAIEWMVCLTGVVNVVCLQEYDGVPDWKCLSVFAPMEIRVYLAGVVSEFSKSCRHADARLRKTSQDMGKICSFKRKTRTNCPSFMLLSKIHNVFQVSLVLLHFFTCANFQSEKSNCAK